jgi:hypothetical protein
MRLFRALLALGILYLANGFCRAALWLKQPVSAPRAPLHPAERLLLGSLVGLAICAIWIAITWRAVA